MTASVGQIVLYCVSEIEANRIEDEARPYDLRTGPNPLAEGTVLPAVIVATWSDGFNRYCNLRVFSNGPARSDLWVTSRMEERHTDAPPTPCRWRSVAPEVTVSVGA